MTVTSVSVKWTEGVSVGVDVIDAHHRHIWRRIRQVGSAAAEGRAEEFRAALRFLHTYLVAHHTEEEQWMLEAGYPGAREHARLHVEIVDSIRNAWEKPLDARRLQETADWVGSTLHAHARLEDVKLGRFWTARQNLRRLAENAPGAAASLTPLPGTLEATKAEPEEPRPTPAPRVRSSQG
jgi:hemerythrin